MSRPRELALLLGACVALAACGGSAAQPRPAATADQVAQASDEFDYTGAPAGWTELSAAEGNQDWVQSVDVGQTAPGQLYLRPYACTWYGDWRGVFLYRMVTGDFDATVRIRTSGSAASVPVRSFSLAGLMARQPRPGGAAAWTPGHENWVFITTGYGDAERGVGVQQIETKTTVNSQSHLELTAVPGGWMELRMIRHGATIDELRRSDGEAEWVFMRRFERPDLPPTLQLGLAAYTDWDPVQATDPAVFNADPTRLPGDLQVWVDYVRVHRPELPSTSLSVADLVKRLNSRH